MKKLTQETKMQLVIGGLVVLGLALASYVAITLPKLKKQEKQIKQMLET